MSLFLQDIPTKFMTTRMELRDALIRGLQGGVLQIPARFSIYRLVTSKLKTADRMENKMTEDAVNQQSVRYDIRNI